MLNEPTLNSRVAVCITRHIAAGLLGTVDSGQRAIIRNRKIAWNASLPLERYVDLTREALVIGRNRVSNDLELSLRLVEWDPWPEAAERYAVGTEVQG